MKDDWVLDVLADLRAFAAQNYFPALAEQLDDTIIVAAAEIKRIGQDKAGQADGHERQDGNAYFRTGGRENPL